MISLCAPSRDLQISIILYCLTWKYFGFSDEADYYSIHIRLRKRLPSTRAPPRNTFPLCRLSTSISDTFFRGRPSLFAAASFSICASQHLRRRLSLPPCQASPKKQIPPHTLPIQFPKPKKKKKKKKPPTYPVTFPPPALERPSSTKKYFEHYDGKVPGKIYINPSPIPGPSRRLLSQFHHPAINEFAKELQAPSEERQTALATGTEWLPAHACGESFLLPEVVPSIYVFVVNP